jgi:DNA-directed RNA polymerase specialized sigma subunit
MALGGANGGKWQKEAGTAFMTYAMPVIKKEGGRYLKKEMQRFLSKQQGA